MPRARFLSLFRLILSILTVGVVSLSLTQCTCAGDETDWARLLIMEGEAANGTCPDSFTPVIDSGSSSGAVCSNDSRDLTWAPIEGANRYEIQLSRTSAFEAGDILASFRQDADPTLPTLTSARIDSELEASGQNLGVNAEIFWRVRTSAQLSSGSSCFSPWSPTAQFNTARLRRPVLVSPASGADECGSGVTFIWDTEFLDGNPKLYTVQVATDPAFGQNLETFGPLTSGGPADMVECGTNLATLFDELDAASPETSQQRMCLSNQDGTVFIRHLFRPSEGLPNGDSLFWRVTAVSDVSDNPTCRLQSAAINPLSVFDLPAPVLTSTDADIPDCEVQPTLTWTRVNFANNYEVAVYQPDAGGQFDVANPVTTNNTGPVAGSDDVVFRLETILPNSTSGIPFVYRVRAIVDGTACASVWSQDERITVSSDLNAISANPGGGLDDDGFICRTNSATVWTTPTNLAWLDDPSVLDGYIIEITRSPNAGGGSTGWTPTGGSTWEPGPTSQINPDLTEDGLVAKLYVSDPDATTLDLRTRIPDLPEGEYFWRVRGFNLDATTNEACEGRSDVPIKLFVDDVPAPTLIEPADGNSPIREDGSCTQSPTFRWDPVATGPDQDQQVYEIQFASNSTMNNLIDTETGLTGTQYTRLNGSNPDPLPTGSLFWRVRPARSECGDLPAWSPVRRVDIVQEVLAPTPLLPLSGAQTCTGDIDLSWSEDLLATEYVVDVSTDANFGSSLAGYPVTQTPTDLTVSVPTGAPATYFWRVRASSASCLSPWSPTRSFQFAQVPLPVPNPTNNLTAERRSGSIRLSWVDPGLADANHSRVVIVRKEKVTPATQPPQDITDGTSLVLADPTSDTQILDPTAAMGDDVTMIYRAFSCNSCDQCVAISPGSEVYIDSDPPRIQTFSASPTQLIEGSSIPDDTVTLSMTVTDNGGLARITRYLVKEDPTPPTVAVMTTTGTVNAPTSYTVASTVLGTVTLYAWIMDEAENLSAVATTSFQRTNNSPLGQVIINPPAASLDVNVTGTDAVSLSISRLTESLFPDTTYTWEMRISNDNTFPAAPIDAQRNTGWIALATNYPSWNLCPVGGCGSDGLQEVFIQFRATHNVNSTVATSTSVMSDTITLDTALPTMTNFMVDGNIGNQTVNSRGISVSFTSFDGTGSAIDSMRLRQSSATPWTEPWVAASLGPTSFTLPPADGNYSLQLQLRDQAGNIGTFTSGTITLFTGVPTGLITITPTNDAYTNSSTVSLAIQSYASTTGMQMWISNDPAFPAATNPNTNTGWIPFAATRSGWQLNQPGTDGTKTVYLRLRNSLGTVGPTLNDTIFLDTSAPTVGGWTLSTTGIGFDGTNYLTNQTNVTVTGITANDGAGSGVTTMAWKIGGAPFSAAVPFAAADVINLPAIDQVYVIQFRVTDAAGNTSAIDSKTIRLDRAAPALVSDPFDGLCATANSITGTYTFNETLNNTIAGPYAVLVGGGTLSSVAIVADDVQIQVGGLSTPDNTHVIQLTGQVQDQAGNAASVNASVFSRAGFANLTWGAAPTNYASCTGLVLDVSPSDRTLCSGDSVTYSWALVSGPAGNTMPATLTSAAPNALTPTVTVPGTYQFRVSTIYAGFTRQSSVRSFVVTNQAPAVSISRTPTYDPLVGERVQLTANVTDDSCSNLSYSWLQLSRPASSAVSSGSSAANIFFTPDVPGTYIYQVTVGDGHTSVSTSISITATRQLVLYATDNSTPNFSQLETHDERYDGVSVSSLASGTPVGNTWRGGTCYPPGNIAFAGRNNTISFTVTNNHPTDTLANLRFQLLGYGLSSGDRVTVGTPTPFTTYFASCAGGPNNCSCYGGGPRSLGPTTIAPGASLTISMVHSGVSDHYIDAVILEGEYQ